MIAFQLREEDEVSSTNECVKELMAAGAPEGAAVMAQAQRGGYGRRGHGWSSPRGGLYLSVLLRPAIHGMRARDGHQADDAPVGKLPTLSLVSALAVRRAICSVVGEEAGQRVQVKWPNDLVVIQDGVMAKLCGISLEGSSEGVCLGIGVNVQPASDPAAGRAFASVSDLMVDAPAPAVLGRLVLEELGVLYEEWLSAPFARFLPEYEAHHIMADRWISADRGGERVEGAFAGVDEDGCLNLIQADGQVIKAVSGDVHIERIMP